MQQIHNILELSRNTDKVKVPGVKPLVLSTLRKLIIGKTKSFIHGKTLATVENDINPLKTSVSEGKSLVAAAVTDKGVPTAADDTFQTMADNIGKISTITGIPAICVPLNVSLGTGSFSYDLSQNCSLHSNSNFHVIDPDSFSRSTLFDSSIYIPSKIKMNEFGEGGILTSSKYTPGIIGVRDNRGDLSPIPMYSISDLRKYNQIQLENIEYGGRYYTIDITFTNIVKTDNIVKIDYNVSGISEIRISFILLAYILFVFN